MVDYLLWYNLKRPYYALGKISPVDYIEINETKYEKKCNMLWMHTNGQLQVDSIMYAIKYYYKGKSTALCLVSL